MTISDYIEQDFPDKRIHHGFTIGRGKKIYWYITPYSKRGVYRCLPIEKDGSIGWPRFITPIEIVHVVYKFNMGDKVVKNEKTWKADDFDNWDRGIGIGVVVEPPFKLDEGEVDVKWPAGRCFEEIYQLKIYKPLDN